jgi:hypothetical protein
MELNSTLTHDHFSFFLPDEQQAIFLILTRHTLDVYSVQYEFQYQLDFSFPLKYHIRDKKIIKHNLFSPKYKNIDCEIDHQDVNILKS